MPPDSLKRRARIAIVCENVSLHLSTRKDNRVRQRAAASNAEIACRQVIPRG
jgi:hypothetical protein